MAIQGQAPPPTSRSGGMGCAGVPCELGQVCGGLWTGPWLASPERRPKPQLLQGGQAGVAIIGLRIGQMGIHPAHLARHRSPLSTANSGPPSGPVNAQTVMPYRLEMQGMRRPLPLASLGRAGWRWLHIVAFSCQ